MTSLLWMPAVLTPVLLAQRFSASGRIPLSALFRYLRKARERDPTIPDPPIDLSGAYFAVCVLAAAIPNQRDEFFYAGVVVLIGWALAPLRPKHHRLAVWASVMVLAAGIGYGTQLGLAQLQATVDDWVSDWLLRGLAADPYRNNTELGAVGRLKMIDAIVLRVYATQADAPRLKLLHRASFNSLHGTTWTARRAPMAPIEPQEDGTTWQLEPGAPSGSARMVTRLESGKALLALPPGTLRVSALPAVAVRRNGLGAMQIELAGDWSPYVAETSGRIEGYAPPSAEDLALPFGERAEFQRLAAELGLEKHNAVERVRTYFASFSYSTYREAPVPEGRSALADFLRESRSGHCEYFAAATTLLLRAAGVPARYATGFAMQEYSELEGAYVVRARHAHAWTRAFVDGRWIDIDTTPPSWFDAEERLAPPWQRLVDWLRWAGFRWSQRGAIEANAWWYGAIALLIVVLFWRLARGKRVRHAATAYGRARPSTGADSEFYAVERAFARRGVARSAHEPLRAWAARVAATLDTPARAMFEQTLALHRRYRFDPAGLTDAERDELRRGCIRMARWAA